MSEVLHCIAILPSYTHMQWQLMAYQSSNIVIMQFCQSNTVIIGQANIRKQLSNRDTKLTVVSTARYVPTLFWGRAPHWKVTVTCWQFLFFAFSCYFSSYSCTDDGIKKGCLTCSCKSYWVHGRCGSYAS